MKRNAYRQRLRHIVIGAATLAVGAASLASARRAAGEDAADAGSPPPTERQSQTAESSSRVDRAEDIIALLHAGNRMEIEGARLALERAQAARVKDYARLLTTEHQRCDQQLLAYVTQKGLDARSLAAGRQPETDGPLERLRLRRPQNFDRAFVLAMVREHGKLRDALTSTMAESHDADLRRLLAEQLPVVEMLKKTGEAILARLPINSAD